MVFKVVECNQDEHQQRKSLSAVSPAATELLRVAAAAATATAAAATAAATTTRRRIGWIFLGAVRR